MYIKRCALCDEPMDIEFETKTDGEGKPVCNECARIIDEGVKMVYDHIVDVNKKVGR